MSGTGKLVTAATAVGLVASLIRPRRPSTAEVMGEITASYVRMLRTATGAVERCHTRITYPHDGGWVTIVCPLERGHEGLHADENHYPFFSDEDVEFFERHYRLTVE